MVKLANNLVTRLARYLVGSRRSRTAKSADSFQRFEEDFRDLFSSVGTADPIYFHKRNGLGAENKRNDLA